MFRTFGRNSSGSFATMAGLLALPVVLSIGLSIDYSRYVSGTSHLQELADIASLTLAGTKEQDEAKLRTMAEDFLSANMGSTKFSAVEILSLVSSNNQVDIGLKATIPTYFMGLANVESVDLHASALAERAVTGSVEVALVLDNTESMNYDSKIATLKTAAGNLVTQLHSNSGASVRIALVPYAEQINVGLANRNASWISVPADYSNSVTSTTTAAGYWNQKTKKAVPNECLTWKEAYSQTVEKDGVPVTTNYARSCTAWKMVNDGDPVWVPEKTTTTTTTTTYTWYGCVGMRVASSKLVLSDDTPSVRYPGLLGKNKAFKCVTEIVPLTTNAQTIKTAITGMITSRGSPYATYTPNTYIPGGLMWGINVLSKAAPYTDGLAYDPVNDKPRKVIVLMTDGLNTMKANTTGLVNTDYLKSGTFIGDTATATKEERPAINTDTTTLCTYAKTNKIEIFTVAFKVDDTAAKTMLEGCASGADHYYDATDSAKLISAFSGIAQSLSEVRLAR